MTDDYAALAWSRVNKGLFALMGAMLLVSLTTQGYQLYLADQAQRQRHQLDAQTALIVDCTQPGGQCYRNAQARQADVLGHPRGPINDVIVLAAACADRPGVATEDQIRACVIKGLTP